VPPAVKVAAVEVLVELKSYLQAKGWRWRPAPGSADNIAVRTCPFCKRSKWKFWIHRQKTIYKCWHCSASGNLYTLKREEGDLNSGVTSAARSAGAAEKQIEPSVPMEQIVKWHKQLMAHDKGKAYCGERGFDLETIKHFKLGLQKKNGKLWLAIPHIINGECYNVKFRSLPPSKKMFRRVKGAASVLFNADCLAEHEEIVIAESETDAISLWQAGIKNVVSLTCGADSFLPEWYDLLADKSKITIVLDADSVGQAGARSIARRLGFDRCFNVLLPMHDANELLVTAGGPALAAALKQTEQFEVSGVLSASDVMMRCRDVEEVGDAGIFTPWHSVNRLLGKGWQPGDLVVLSAKIKVGKTSAALGIANDLAQQNIPSMIMCLEMSVDRLGQKIAAILRKKPADDLRSVDYAVARYELRRTPLYFIEPDWRTTMKVDDVFDRVREAVKRHGIRFFVFDHLHFLCRDIRNLTNEIGNVTRSFKLLSEELHITTLLIAQPKKTQSGQMITYDDIKDSASIPADADQIVLLHRKPRPAGLDGDADSSSDQEVLEPKTLVRIDAARFRGGGEALLYFDGARSTFLEWDDRPDAEQL
jgi:twinkle protein